jgi:WD40 repeat protein
MDLTPDGRTAAVTSKTKIYVWDGFTGQPIVSMDHSIYLWTVEISSDGKMIASGGDLGNIKLWDLKTGKEIYTLVHSNVVWNTIWSFAFSPDNMILVSGDLDGNTTFWDTHTGKALHNLVDPDGNSTNSIAFSPDAQILAIGTDYRITLWDVNSYQRIRTLEFDLRGGEGYSGIRGVLFSPDGKMIAAANGDNLAMVWEVASGKKLSTIIGPYTIL